MKVFSVSTAAAVAVVLAGPAAGQTSYVPGAGLNGSPHDFRASGGTTTGGSSESRLCIYCHAPHDTYRASGTTTGTGPMAAGGYQYLPLWNHSLSSAPPVYAMYDPGPGGPRTGPGASQASSFSTAPGAVSLLCLSCHDGSIAVSRYGNSEQPPASVGTGTRFVPAISRVGQDGDLGNHHPIGFDYDAVKSSDSGLRDADSTSMTTASSIRDHLYGGDEAGRHARLECATCHSVHNRGNRGEKLLWRSDQGSELCLTCHDKGLLLAAR
jgi:predicted CXXCH cytochrome family protein